MISEFSENTSAIDYSAVWKKCLEKIKKNVTQMTYNTWFLPIKPVQLSNNIMKVELPSRFFWEWIDEHYNLLINKTITEIIGPEAKLTYIIDEETGEDENLLGDVLETSYREHTIKEKPKVNHNFE